MLRTPSDRHILGTPLWLFVTPFMLLGSWKLRGRTPLVRPEYPEHEWMRVEWCKACSNETDHEYIQYRDEAVVTRQCMDCEHLSSYWDMV